MPTWVPPAICSFAIFAASVAVQFYRGFVPDIEEQKRHLKSAGMWALDVFALALQGICICILVGRDGPVTRPLCGVSRHIGE